MASDLAIVSPIESESARSRTLENQFLNLLASRLCRYSYGGDPWTESSPVLTRIFKAGARLFISSYSSKLLHDGPCLVGIEVRHRGSGLICVLAKILLKELSAPINHEGHHA